VFNVGYQIRIHRCLMPFSDWYAPDPRFLALAEGFSDTVAPAVFTKLRRRFRNQPWAYRVGLGQLSEAEWEQHLGQLNPLPDNLPVAHALRYHGHQFRQYNPYLGDGRGFLLAQLRDPVDGRLLDLGTKGSGETPWSRGGDGRLTLKGGVREALATEMLEALGVNTSKTLSLFETGESLIRHDEPSPTRSCIMVRLSHSHIRFGSFQRLQYIGDTAGLEALLDHAIGLHFPALADAAEADRPARFFAAVTERVADTAAGWMVAGFVHGVLNTDNMNITGESFDYGPYRFLPRCDPNFTAAYFDNTGLYRYSRQPEAAGWNLCRLADALAPLTTPEALKPAFETFGPTFAGRLRIRLLDRLGLVPRNTEADAQLTAMVFRFLELSPVGFDDFFFDWYGGTASADRAMTGPRSHLYQGADFTDLETLLSGYVPAHPARLSDPYFEREGACSLLIDELEALWDDIAERDDWAAFEAKIAGIRGMRTLFGRAPVMPEQATCPVVREA
jgi:uncharacterized protein YdiU (UPF0061 family)